jgi:four helix bundle protein
MFYGYGLPAMDHGLIRYGFQIRGINVLSSQIKRATDSIALNIAEGSTGQSNPEINKFLGYAVRSAIEVASCLHIGRKRSIIKEDDFLNIYTESTIIIKMIQALRNSLN